MNQRIKKLVARFIRGAPAALALAALWTATAPLNAEAALAGSTGNTIIRNTITVNYSDAKGAGQTPVSATIDITVNNVAATPTIVSFTPSPGSTDGTGATQAYTVRIRTNSNGPGSIALSAADGTPINIAVSGTGPTVAVSIYLGSTIFDPSNFPAMVAQSIASNATITIAVPNDGGKDDGTGATHAMPSTTVINGLNVNDIVYITDGTTPIGPWQVTAVNDPIVGVGATAAPGSVTLKNISSPASAYNFTPATGWQIVESKDVTVTVTQGVVPYATANLAASWVTTLKATMAGASAATSPVTTNAHMGKIVVTKYARNTNTASGTGGLYSPPVFTNNFYTTGVTGNPTETLEYLAVIDNQGTGDAKVVYATDLTPTYSSLITFSATYGSSPGSTLPGYFARASINAVAPADLKTDGTGAANVNVGYGNSTGTAAGSTMSFYLGNGCANLAGGKLVAGDKAYVIYQVKIN